MKKEASVTGKRQITIPKEVYTELGLNIADKLIFEKNENNEIVIKKKEISKYEICPICDREVRNEDTMVVNKYQRYHMTCWNMEDEAKGIEEDRNVISAKLTKTQAETLERVLNVKKVQTLEMIQSIRDNEVVITVPVKITFMEKRPGVIGEVKGLNSDHIFKCNPMVQTEE